MIQALARVFFCCGTFLLVPRSLLSGFFFAVVPGCAKCFFCCCAPLGAATFRRGQSKKKHHPGCFFLLWPRAGAQRASPSPAFRRGRSQKTKTWVVFLFFLRWPRAQQKRHFAHPGTTATKIKETNDTGHEQKGATKKKLLTHCGPGPRCSLTSFPGRLFRPGPAGVFFCCGPARTLTHSLRAWAAMPPAGVVFFFAAAPPGPGWCFVFLLWPRPDAHSLTHCGLGRFRQGPGGVSFFFFCCGPAEPGEPITKNVWCTTSGLKRPRGATAKKKNTTSEAPCNSRVYKD